MEEPNNPKYENEDPEFQKDSEAIHDKGLSKLSSTSTLKKIKLSLGIDVSPEGFDIIFLPTNDSTPSELAIKIINKLGLDLSLFNNLKPFNDGFKWLREVRTNSGVCDFCFIKNVTIGALRIEELKKNIQDSLKGNLNGFSNKKIWIPLLATGTTGIPHNESLNSLLTVLQSIYSDLISLDEPIEIIIALPPNIREYKNLFVKFDEFVKTLQKIKSKASNVPAWIDSPEVNDYLNRTPLAKSLASILTILYQEGNKGSIMIHLQGSWGSGKSSFLNILEKQLYNDSKNTWVVIKFNAWQNQHISPPWWTFLNSIYLQSKSQVKNKICLWFSEVFRRWKTGKLYLKLLTYLLLIITIVLFILYAPYLKEITTEQENIDFVKLASAFVSFVATIFSFIATLTTSALGGSSKSADTFMKLAQDPMQQIKKHFNSLIKSINKPVIIYIDDLDRCNALYVVGLLEGIQTLFKDSKVFYIVAADKHWISQCFEIVYEKFKEVNKNPNSSLGYNFLQKMFQFSIRLPNISDKLKNSYWDYILKIEKPKIVEKTKEIRDIFSGMQSEDDVNVKVKELENEKNMPESMIRQAAVERLNEKDLEEKTEHVLREYSVYLDSNPRAIKRLANYYNVFRNTLILEGKLYDKSIIIRWLVLNEKYPLLVESMEKNPAYFTTNIKPITEMECTQKDDLFLKELIKGMNNDPEMTYNDINDLIGVY